MKLTEEKLDSTLKYKGVVIDVYNDRVLLENGKEATRDVVRHPGGVCVVALNEDNEVYFVRQFRYPHGKVLLEIPAGKFDKDESSLDCVKRELKEEIGFSDFDNPIITNYTDEVKEKSGKTIHNIELDFIIEANKENINITLSKEHTEYAWVPKESELLDDYIKAKLLNL